MSKIKLMVNKDKLISIAKKMLVLILIISNIVALGYMYRELSSLKAKLAVATAIPTAQPIAQTTDTDALLADLSKRLGKLETGASLLGQTLTSCSVVPEAYNKFGPRPEFDSQLNNCANNYKKLQRNL